MLGHSETVTRLPAKDGAGATSRSPKSRYLGRTWVKDRLIDM